MTILYIFADNVLLYKYARVVKLVYTYALGAYAARCAGSSPVSGTRGRIVPSGAVFTMVRNLN